MKNIFIHRVLSLCTYSFMNYSLKVHGRKNNYRFDLSMWKALIWIANYSQSKWACQRIVSFYSYFKIGEI